MYVFFTRQKIVKLLNILSKVKNKYYPKINQNSNIFLQIFPIALAVAFNVVALTTEETVSACI